MIWPFRRKPAAPPPFVKPVDDWKPGDMAQCIAPDFLSWQAPPDLACHGPRRGDILLVTRVILGPATDPTVNVTGVGLVFGSRPGAWHANCFRKLRPCADELDRRAADKLPQVRHPETVG